MHACYHDGMAQMTWRSDSELLERVRRSAAAANRSMNEYVTAVLDAATDPDLASDEAERVRERLARAGLLAAVPAPHRQRPSRRRVEAARKAAAEGTALADIVSTDRR